MPARLSDRHLETTDAITLLRYYTASFGELHMGKGRGMGIYIFYIYYNIYKINNIYNREIEVVTGANEAAK